MKKKRKVKILWDRVIIAVFLLIMIILIIASLISKKSDKNNNEAKSQTSNNPASETTDAQEPDNTVNANYDFIEVSEDQIHKGNLILINNHYQYSAGEPENLINIYKNKTTNYKVAYTDISVNSEALTNLNSMTAAFVTSQNVTNLMVSHAYRTLNEQQEKYDDAVSNNKDLLDSENVKAGFSEHNAGLAVDFAIFPPGDGTYPAYDGTGAFSWIAENAYKYGFVLRYTEDKESITGVNADITHYRYVGYPHSEIMHQKDICLEEYLDFIKQNYTFGQSNPCTIATSDKSVTYEIYYVATEGATTEVPVPKEYNYTISGNNYDGYIVTVTK